MDLVRFIEILYDRRIYATQIVIWWVSRADRNKYKIQMPEEISRVIVKYITHPDCNKPKNTRVGLCSVLKNNWLYYYDKCGNRYYSLLSQDPIEWNDFYRRITLSICENNTITLLDALRNRIPYNEYCIRPTFIRHIDTLTLFIPNFIYSNLWFIRCYGYLCDANIHFGHSVQHDESSISHVVQLIDRSVYALLQTRILPYLRKLADCLLDFKYKFLLPITTRIILGSLTTADGFNVSTCDIAIYRSTMNCMRNNPTAAIEYSESTLEGQKAAIIRFCMLHLDTYSNYYGKCTGDTFKYAVYLAGIVDRDEQLGWEALPEPHLFNY